MSRARDSPVRWPIHYESSAETHNLRFTCLRAKGKEPTVRLELTTYPLRRDCSATELSRHFGRYGDTVALSLSYLGVVVNIKSIWILLIECFSFVKRCRFRYKRNNNYFVSFMADKIPDSEITLKIVLQAILECFYQAHFKDTDLLESEKATRAYCVRVVWKAFKETEADFENPTNEGLPKEKRWLLLPTFLKPSGTKKS